MYSVKQIYAYVVCLVAVSCFSINTGVALYRLVRISAPQLTVRGYRWQQVSSLDKYKKSYTQKCADKIDTTPQFPEDEWQAKLEEEKRSVLEEEQRDALQDFIQSVIIIVISGILFIIHWGMAKKRVSNPKE
jgi:hypothetical protein